MKMKGDLWKSETNLSLRESHRLGLRYTWFMFFDCLAYHRFFYVLNNMNITCRVWGTVCLTVAFIWQLYSIFLLVELHESVPGIRHSRYLFLAMAAFGNLNFSLLQIQLKSVHQSFTWIHLFPKLLSAFFYSSSTTTIKLARPSRYNVFQ